MEYSKDGIHSIVQSVDPWHKISLYISTVKRQTELTLIFHMHWQPSGTVTTIKIYYISGETLHLCSRDKEKEGLNVSVPDIFVIIISL